MLHQWMIFFQPNFNDFARYATPKSYGFSNPPVTLLEYQPPWVAQVDYALSNLEQMSSERSDFPGTHASTIGRFGRIEWFVRFVRELFPETWWWTLETLETASQSGQSFDSFFSAPGMLVERSPLQHLSFSFACFFVSVLGGVRWD